MNIVRRYRCWVFLYTPTAFTLIVIASVAMDNTAVLALTLPWALYARYSVRRLRCPRCGHRIGEFEADIFGDKRTLWTPFVDSSCRNCGWNLHE